jgi:hypothetical protein
MWNTSRPALTAEWNCTRCGVTNRKLAPLQTTELKDQCVHCGARHDLRPGDRPVRWHAEAS